MTARNMLPAPAGQMSRLQTVLRAAALLVLGLPGRVPVSAVIHDTRTSLADGDLPAACHVQAMSHHHHHWGLVGDVAVPVSAHQVVLSCAFLNPDARPRLNGRRSTSTVLSQVCLGRPRRRFQSLGVCHMHVRRARE